MRTLLTQALVLSWLVAAGALRQRETSSLAAGAPNDGTEDGLVTADKLVPSRTGREGGSALVPGEQPEQSAAGTDATTPQPVCVERPVSSAVSAPATAKSADEESSGEDGSVPSSFGKLEPYGAGVGDGQDSRILAESKQIGVDSVALAKSLGATRAWVSMVELCDTKRFALSDGYFLLRALTLAKNLRDVNSSYPLIVFITDYKECDLLWEYEDKYIEELNMKFVRMPNNIFTMDVLPELLFANWRLNYPKAYLFGMMGFQRIVSLDVDITFLRNSDDLFDLPEPKKVYMSRRQNDCSLHPFEANAHKAANHLFVIKPRIADFMSIKYQYQLARDREDRRVESTWAMTQLFTEQERLELLPMADMLNVECLANFKCEMAGIRSLHLGDMGNRIVSDQRKFSELKVDIDYAWKPVFQNWADNCHAKAVRKVCKEKCNDLCVRNITWMCSTC